MVEKIAPSLSRRTVVTAAAWSAPVIAVAAATPAAAASTAGAVDLFADGLQMGSGMTYFNKDLTTRYETADPLGFTLLNNGPEPAPAGSVSVQVRYDNRVFTPTEVTISGSEPIPFSTPVASGDASTFTFTVPQQVEVETDVFGPNALRVITRFDGSFAYPNDVFDDYVEPSWTILSDDDADTSNNIFGPFTSTPYPATPWGLTLETETTSLTSGSCTFDVPTSVTVTSVGPNPTPEAVTGYLRLDTGLVSSVSLTGATHNGNSILSDVVFESSGGAYSFNLGRPLEADDVVVLSFDVEAAENGGVNGDMAQIGVSGFNGQDLNERLTISYFDFDKPVCAP